VEYVYTQNPTDSRPIILVDKYIGTDNKGVTGIDGGQFAREILALKNSGKTECEVWINSKGGNISDGFNIYGSLKNSGLHVTTVNMGAVDSTAGWIYQAGDHRVWMNYGLGLIHNVQGAGKHIDAANLSVATMLSQGSKGKKTVEECLALMNSDTVMNYDMAEQYGFCDEVKNCSDILSFTNSSDANEIIQFGEQQTKKLLPKNKNMEALNQLLGLTNEASETARLAAVNKIIEARNAAETALATKTAELATTTTSLNEANGKLLVAEANLLTATNANKKIAAEALVKEHVGKRIEDKPETIEKWTNQAIADYEGTKALIEGINYNVKAPATPVSGQRSANAPVINVAEYMARK